MSDTSHFGFGKFVPGFDFLQSLAKGAASGIPQMPQLSHWVAPTLSVEELEKRIDELKAVQFWLEQNSRALAATIQALEVQKMTLATLKGMNVSMGDVASAFKFQGSDAVMQGMQKAADAFSGAARSAAPQAAPQAAPVPPQPAPAPAPAPDAAASQESTDQAPKAEPPSRPGVVDPLHWWGALTTQFQEIASNALKDASHHGSALDTTQHLAKDALKKATDMASHLAAQGVQSLQEVARAAQAAAPTAAQRKASSGSAGAPRTSAPAQSAPGKRAGSAQGSKGRSASGKATPAAKPAAKKAAAKKTVKKAVPKASRSR